MLPTSPNRVRRRPRAIPRAHVGRDRAGRNMSVTLDPTQSASSSRSTSRSRSPYPHRGSLPSGVIDDAIDGDSKFLAALQVLIVCATDVLDLSVNSLLSRPGICPEIIGRVQKVGQSWDDHDDWPGRDWYVDILMAVANLNRVLDWWEAEKGFWNFDEEDANEPLLFVMRPNREESKFEEQFKAALKDADSVPTPEVHDPTSSTINIEVPSPRTLLSDYSSTTAVGPVTGTPKAQGVDDLRFLAEHAKSVNIVMELSLQGEEILYINDAIMEVIG